MLLESAGGIGLEAERADLLEAVAPLLPDDDAVRAAYEDAVKTIRLGSEYRRAAEALPHRR